jgi:hypothetical protein
MCVEFALRRVTSVVPVMALSWVLSLGAAEAQVPLPGVAELCGGVVTDPCVIVHEVYEVDADGGFAGWGFLQFKNDEDVFVDVVLQAEIVGEGFFGGVLWVEAKSFSVEGPGRIALHGNPGSLGFHQGEGGYVGVTTDEDIVLHQGETEKVSIDVSGRGLGGSVHLTSLGGTIRGDGGGVALGEGGRDASTSRLTQTKRRERAWFS